jgi:hypothetical protein
MEEPDKYLYKNKRKRQNYSACYTYKTSFGYQYIYVKYEQDVRAIDLLLENSFQKQAVMLADHRINVFK